LREALLEKGKDGGFFGLQATQPVGDFLLGALFERFEHRALDIC